MPIRTIILLVVLTVMSALTLRALRLHRLHERYVLVFLVTGIPILWLALWPDGIVWLESTLKIEKPTLLVMAIATYFLFVTFSLASKVSIQEEQIQSLAQELAVLKSQQRDASARLDEYAHRRPLDVPREVVAMSEEHEAG